MSQADVRFVATVNTAPMDAAMDESVARTERLTNHMLGNIRRATELTIALIQASGIAIDQTFAIGIQAGIRILELYQSASALTIAQLGTNPMAFLQVAAQAGAIAGMLITIGNLKAGRIEAARISSFAYRALQVATWKG